MQGQFLHCVVQMTINLRILGLFLFLICTVCSSPAYAQSSWDNPDKINANFDRLKARYGQAEIQTPGEIQDPGDIDEPSSIQEPSSLPQAAQAEQDEDVSVLTTADSPEQAQEPQSLESLPVPLPTALRQVVEFKKEGCKNRLLVSSDFLFAFDKAELSEAAKQKLGLLAPILAQYNGRVITIEGHTDSIGSDAYNDTLSRKRALAVMGFLVQQQAVSGANVAGYGEHKPVAPNAKTNGQDNPTGRAKNRRVEIVINTCG